MIFSKAYQEPPFDEAEALRYAGCREADNETAALLGACIREARDQLTYKVCWREFAVSADGDTCDFGAFRLPSRKLAQRLHGCERAVVFAATVGIGLDRLIAKYGRVSPAKALMMQAIGAERIEALCDAFCADMAGEYGGGLTPRFSPGYGDLPLASQRDIFAVLDCERRIGLTLNDSLLMSPSKSVTAIVGIGNGAPTITNQCSACTMTGCSFRGAV